MPKGANAIDEDGGKEDSRVNQSMSMNHVAVFELLPKPLISVAEQAHEVAKSYEEFERLFTSWVPEDWMTAVQNLSRVVWDWLESRI